MLLLSAAALLPFGLANAQQDDDDQAIDEIVTVGTQTGTGIRGVAPVGSQTMEIPRVELVQSPVRDAAEIIANLPLV